jgi:HK97 family phage major capsid protein
MRRSYPVKNIHAIQQRGEVLKTKCRTLLDAAAAEDRDLNEAEAAQYETHLKAMVENEKQLAREMKVLEFERNSPVVGDENRAAAERAGAPSSDTPKFANLGEQLRAVVQAERTNGRVVDQRLVQASATGAGESVPSDGGFLVQPDFAQEIWTRAHDMGQLLSRVRRTPVTGNGLKMNAIDETSRVDGSRWGGVQAYWANEADSVTAKKPKFRRMELELEKLFATYYATDELLEDTAAFGNIATLAFSEELTFKTEDAIYEGDGSGKPLGIIKAPCLVTVNKETNQVAATLVAENVLKMFSRLPSRSLRNAIWLCNVDVLPQLPQLNIKVKNVAGTENVGGLLTPIYQFPSGANFPGPGNPDGYGNDNFGTILGRPVVPVEYSSTLGTLGDLLLADLSQYQLIEKAGGAKLAQSMHVRFLNDEMCFRLTYRVDGEPLWNAPLTPFKGANTLSPFVALQTR